MKRDRDGLFSAGILRKSCGLCRRILCDVATKGRRRERAFGCLFALLFGTKSTQRSLLLGIFVVIFQPLNIACLLLSSYATMKESNRPSISWKNALYRVGREDIKRAGRRRHRWSRSCCICGRRRASEFWGTKKLPRFYRARLKGGPQVR